MLSKPTLSTNLKLPGGIPAGDMDRIFLQLQWVHECRKEKNVKVLGVGHPSVPVEPIICIESEKHWKSLAEQEHEFQADLKAVQNLSDEEFKSKKYEDFPLSLQSLLNNTFDRSPPMLDKKLQSLVAEGCEKFYGLSLPRYEQILHIGLENIIFTQGGAGGLNSILRILNKHKPKGRVLVQAPYYILYANRGSPNELLTYTVIKSNSIADTNSQEVSFSDAIKKAEETNSEINVAIFCTPNNPSGKGITHEEWEEIVRVSQNKDFYFIFDEAYAELDFAKKPLFLEFITQKLASIEQMFPKEKQEEIKNTYFDLLRRSIILRSATKGCSASGERQAIIMAFDKPMIAALIAENRHIGFPPYGTQKAYAEIMYHWSPRSFDAKVEFLSQFYETQVRYVERKFKEMGIAVSDGTGTGTAVDGTFYVIGDFKSLLGSKVTNNEIRDRLKAIGLNGDTIQTDEDLAYLFLVDYTIGIMLTPMSYFGGDPTEGKLRMTCSEGKMVLDKVLDKISKVLERARNQDECYPPMTPVTPALPYSPSMMSQDHFLPLPPRENFAKRMETYWNNKKNNSQTAIQLRTKAYDMFKTLIKPHFVEAIHKILSSSSSASFFSSSSFFTREREHGPILQQELLEKKGEILNIVEEVLAYLKKHQITIFERIFPASQELANNKTADFNPDLTNALEVYINNYQKISKNIQKGRTDTVNGHKETDPDVLINQFSTLLITSSITTSTLISQLSGLPNERELIANLVFEKIFYDTIVEPIDFEKNPFADIVDTFYHLEKEKIKLLVIQIIAEKRASISYGHPKGDKKNLATMADALSLWYEIKIQPEEILFVTIRPKALLEKTFGKKLVILSHNHETVIQALQQPNDDATTGKIILQINASDMLGIPLQEEELITKVQFITAILKADPKHIIVIDESYVERCIDQSLPLGKNSLINYLSEFRDRIILIRSSKGIFTSETESISILFTSNQDIMAKLLAESIALHVHAQRSYQDAYAGSFHDFVKGISTNDEYKKEALQELEATRKVRCHIAKQLYEKWRQPQATAQYGAATPLTQVKTSPAAPSITLNQTAPIMRWPPTEENFPHLKGKELWPAMQRFLQDQQSTKMPQSNPTPSLEQGKPKRSRSRPAHIVSLSATDLEPLSQQPNVPTKRVQFSGTQLKKLYQQYDLISKTVQPSATNMGESSATFIPTGTTHKRKLEETAGQNGEEDFSKKSRSQSPTQVPVPPNTLIFSNQPPYNEMNLSMSTAKPFTPFMEYSIQNLKQSVMKTNDTQNMSEPAAFTPLQNSSISRTPLTDTISEPYSPLPTTPRSVSPVKS